jgi:hypothetical protein
MLWNYSNIDTLYYRFTFSSDSIETNQQGWLLDDIKLIEHTEGIQDFGSRNEISIYPNPADNVITVSVKAFTSAMDVSVYDILGQLQLKQTLYKNKQDIDISGLSKGIYMVKVLGGNNSSASMIIKE